VLALPRGQDFISSQDLKRKKKNLVHEQPARQNLYTEKKTKGTVEPTVRRTIRGLDRQGWVAFATQVKAREKKMGKRKKQGGCYLDGAFMPPKMLGRGSRVRQASRR